MSLFTKDKIVGNKKIIENMVLFLVLFIIVIVVINSLENKESNTIISNTNVEQIVEHKGKVETLEEKMANILSLINGAGKVDVLITYSSGSEQIPMYNTKQNTIITEESDKAGGTRKTEEVSNEQNIIFNENGNVKTPVLKQTINPQIVGVLVVADGAENINIKENIINAVKAALDVPSHRVQVFARKRN
ncbi:MAG: stage III sporulation protein AG [Clostridia bacterium]|nr:stage III sporulation protein AG [Clostridia bacterium]